MQTQTDSRILVRIMAHVCLYALAGLLSIGVQTRQAVAQITPEAAAAQMGRGINLGNTLEPPTEGAWNNGPAEEAFFDAYADAGFTTVRIPVRWDQHTQQSVPYLVEPSFLARVEEVVDWALDRDMFAVINAHHEDWLKADYSSTGNRARFDSIWVQVSQHFASKSEKLLFEIINEPYGLTVDDVDDLNTRTLSLIRQSNPTRIVIYSGNEYSNAEQLYTAAMPDDPFIMAYYHSYDPWEFAGLANRTWGDGSDISTLQSKINGARSWSDANSVPVIVSEFGAIHTADYNSRMRYYQTYVEALVGAHIPFQVWDDGGDFEVLVRDQLEWRDTKDILINAYPDGPTGFGIVVAGDSMASLSWTNRSQHNRIRIERSRESEPYSTIGIVDATDEVFHDSTLQAGVEYRYRLIAENTLVGDRYSHPLKVILEQQQSSFLGYPHGLPGVIEAENYDFGGEGTAYHDTDPVNTPGEYRPFEGVDIEARLDGGYHIGYVEAGEWLEYTVDVAEAGMYSVTAEVASLVGGGRVHFLVGEVGSDRLVVPSTGSWQTTTTVATEMELDQGIQTLRVSIISLPEFNIDRISFVKAGASGIEQADTRTTVELFPNPASSELILHGSASVIGKTVSVFDAVGRIVDTFDLAAPSTSIDVSEYADGIYLLSVAGQNSVTAASFVVTR